MKIVFLAMSGIRVFDQELLEIGLTVPGFVERSKTIASLPSLGLLTLAALTPSHWEIEYREIDEMKEGEVEALGLADIVAFSTFTARAFDAYALSGSLRKRGIYTVIGGLHASLCPSECAEHFDCVIEGEGEPVWNDLLSDFEYGRPRSHYKANRAYDLSQAPIPRFDLLEVERYNRLTVQTTRGCPWECEFCAASIRLGGGYRCKPVDKVLAELDAIRSHWAHPFVEFADDNTFASKRYGHRLMDALQGCDFRWFTETDISIAHDSALLAKMKKAGCAQVLIGLEDPSDVSGVELKADWKAKQRAGYLESIKRIQDHGITVNGCFVLGFDSHKPDVFDRYWEFIRESNLFEVQLTFLTPFPGTPLYDRLAKENRLLHANDWRRRTLFDICFEPKQMSAAELRDGFIDLARKVYDDAEVDRRRRNFIRSKMLADVV
ncbi:radical SAM protein [Pelagicoccus enzymogenes]|uniref:B12-binding domain-containing radical SAM protein n=1 Tax=Pelagicoccus enzymogenes TaxID=2773457 RepID=UPI00280FBF71|nr:radical SAM protein [Pelagicoccus enzymogenes]MDQ8199245.1 radical SAM protein [Pelagicoccus enzymogenes]